MSDWTSKDKWFRHRVNSIGSDARLGKLLRISGAEGYAVYFLALEYIYDEGLGEIELEDMAAKLKMKKDDVTLCLQLMQDKCNGLLVSKDGRWTSPKAEELMAKDQAKRDDMKQRSKKYRDTHKNVTNVNENIRKNTEINALISFEKEESKKEEHKNSLTKGLVLKGVVGGKGRPTREEVVSSMQRMGRSFDPDAFIAFFDSNGWTIKGEPMRNLDSVVKAWPDDKAGQRDTHGYKESDLAGVYYGRLS